MNMHAQERLRLIRPRSGIVLAHLTCDKQIWSLAHLLNPTESTCNTTQSNATVCGNSQNVYGNSRTHKLKLTLMSRSFLNKSSLLQPPTASGLLDSYNCKCKSLLFKMLSEPVLMERYTRSPMTDTCHGYRAHQC
uniref:AlNc14C16G1735 protein n=1 Tax=Albugo laibachii Nc14 TaxID=890382 RepID=F0W452_9STRA|nr:AlNc14C16G1735 [Albugo laibachii Nc14]|eukprot:CCA15850.1 AlNc14C16G1735 [Albugo laibachii Nc14]